MDERNSTEDDAVEFFPDTCFTCGGSSIAAERRGYQRAVDALRDSQAKARYPADRECMKIAADYLAERPPVTTPPTDKITDEKPWVRIKPYGRWSYSLEVVEGMFVYPGPFAYSRRSAERKARRLLTAHTRRRSRQGWEFRP